MTQQYLFRPCCGADDVSDIVEVENGQPGPPVPSGPPVTLTVAARLAIDAAVDAGRWDLREQANQVELARTIATAVAASGWKR